MKQFNGGEYRVLVPTIMFGSVRCNKGDVVRRELLGTNALKLVQKGVVEPILKVAMAPRSGQPTML